MKHLQNNFTDLIQSKRLLDLGIPEWTADCLIKNNAEEDGPTIRVKEPYTAYYFAKNSYIPCWSVGRLMEIYDACVDNDEGWPVVKSNISYVINTIVAIDYAVREGKIDFSKLED